MNAQHSWLLEVERLHKRMAEIAAIDFFNTPEREAAEQVIFSLEARLQDRLRRSKPHGENGRLAISKA